MPRRKSAVLEAKISVSFLLLNLITLPVIAKSNCEENESTQSDQIFTAAEQDSSVEEIDLKITAATATWKKADDRSNSSPIVYSANGKILVIKGATSASESTLRVFDAEKKSLIAEIPNVTGSYRSYGISPTGDSIAFFRDSKLVTRNLSTGNEAIVDKFKPKAAIYGLDLVTFNGRFALVSGMEGYDEKAIRHYQIVDTSTGEVESFQVSAQFDSERAIMSSDGQTIFLASGRAPRKGTLLKYQKGGQQTVIDPKKVSLSWPHNLKLDPTGKFLSYVDVNFSSSALWTEIHVLSTNDLSQVLFTNGNRNANDGEPLLEFSDDQKSIQALDTTKYKKITYQLSDGKILGEESFDKARASSNPKSVLSANFVAEYAKDENALYVHGLKTGKVIKISNLSSLFLTQGSGEKGSDHFISPDINISPDESTLVIKGRIEKEADDPNATTILHIIDLNKSK